MSALRFCALAVIVAASLANAITCTAPSTNAMLYGNATGGCTQTTTCQAAFCACLGAGSTHQGGFSCSAPTAAAGCSKATACIGVLTRCIAASANANATGCSHIAALKTSVMTVESGSALWNATTAYTSCVYQSCVWLNATGGVNCTVSNADLCPPPVQFVGTLLLTGSFSGLLANATQRDNFAAALARDLSRFLRILVKILRMWVHGTARPDRANVRQGNERLVVEFAAVGVSGSNTEFAAQLNSLKSQSSAGWMSEAGAAYTAANPGATIGFAGVSAGGISSAFASRGGLSKAVGAIPTTTTTSATTGTTGTTATTSATSGAAFTSCLVAVIVAVMSAMLF